MDADEGSLSQRSVHFGSTEEGTTLVKKHSGWSCESRTICIGKMMQHFPTQSPPSLKCVTLFYRRMYITKWPWVLYLKQIKFKVMI